MKAELLGNDWVGGGDGILFMTITHHCNGNRRLNIALPPSYFNQGLVVVKTFDLGTINLEARYSEEGNEFGGARGIGFGRGGRLGGLGEFGGLAQPIL
ncbi:hypothetical protein GCK32_015846 [Trichostrongylus colubriformis]|uniref:Uncharacterized protein n=1 Tax=Trichostrongylus colubriformis TaxID=6319 RepID=A0AAN8FWH9_TRICO